MKEKYYTPEIEEFHVGFEFEIHSTALDKRHENEWIPVTYGDDGMIFAIKYTNEQLSKFARIKHIDQEDLINLGWRYVTQEPHGKYEVYSIHPYNLCIYPTNNHILIDNAGDAGVADAMVYFSGKIKNKSELKQLMKQLNITT